MPTETIQDDLPAVSSRCKVQLSYESLYRLEVLVIAEFCLWPGNSVGLPKEHSKVVDVYVANAPSGQRAVDAALESIGDTIEHVDKWDRRKSYEGVVISKSVERLSREQAVPLGQEILLWSAG